MVTVHLGCKVFVWFSSSFVMAVAGVIFMKRKQKESLKFALLQFFLFKFVVIAKFRYASRLVYWSKNVRFITWKKISGYNWL